MEKDFWIERWELQQIGFHQNEVNPYLERHGDHLSGRVFVPLCGKSHDMTWLAAQGAEVLGVELSPIAARAYFDESGIKAACRPFGKFESHEAEGLRILCGDFFDLTQEDVKDVNAVYDRASMIALPPGMRERYVHHMMSILPQGTKILLITLDYPQAEMQGPPFAVSVDEVQRLYRDHAGIKLLEQADVLEPRFAQRGVTMMRENVFLLKCKG
jgi:thiopurine S-methyltransferase